MGPQPTPKQECPTIPQVSHVRASRYSLVDGIASRNCGRGMRARGLNSQPPVEPSCCWLVCVRVLVVGVCFRDVIRMRPPSKYIQRPQLRASPCPQLRASPLSNRVRQRQSESDSELAVPSSAPQHGHVLRQYISPWRTGSPHPAHLQPGHITGSFCRLPLPLPLPLFLLLPKMPPRQTQPLLWGGNPGSGKGIVV